MTAPMSDTMQKASGGIIAQEVMTAVHEGRRDPEFGWLKFVELMAQHGRHSQAARAYIVEIIKRAAR